MIVELYVLNFFYFYFNVWIVEVMNLIFLSVCKVGGSVYYDQHANEELLKLLIKEAIQKAQFEHITCCSLL